MIKGFGRGSKVLGIPTGMVAHRSKDKFYEPALNPPESKQ